jgi:hypothetical protein
MASATKKSKSIKQLMNQLLIKMSLGSLVVKQNHRLQAYRYANRGSIYLFAPMLDFNVMAEVGETPP